MRCSRRTDTRSRRLDPSSSEAAREGKSNAGFHVDADFQCNGVARFTSKSGRVFPSKLAFMCNSFDINHLPLDTFEPPLASKHREGGQNFDENAFATDEGNGRSGFSENATPGNLDACDNRNFAGLFRARADRGRTAFWNAIRDNIFVRRNLLHARGAWEYGVVFRAELESKPLPRRRGAATGRSSTLAMACWSPSVKDKAAMNIQGLPSNGTGLARNKKQGGGGDFVRRLWSSLQGSRNYLIQDFVSV